jgi:hypothetical protein
MGETGTIMRVATTSKKSKPLIELSKFHPFLILTFISYAVDEEFNFNIYNNTWLLANSINIVYTL